MKIPSTLTLLATSALLAAGCAPANPQLHAPTDIQVVGEKIAVIPPGVDAPKVDILFVIDNSDSMIHHQENLKKNMNRFVEAFEANKHLDFHIGVTAIWDSIRYNGVTVTADKFHPLGLLYPVKTESLTANASQPAPLAPATFVTRSANYVEVLGETLKIGVIPFAMGGPENEELFSPVVAAIDGRNPGFIRPDAHLAVIMITDADDVSSISPTKLRDSLAQSKGGDKSMYSTYAVLSLSKACPKDPGNRKDPNRQILDFLKKTDGQAYDLCDAHFGDKLAEAGRAIEKKASGEMTIYLDSIPADGTLKVVFKGSSEEVPYAYDSTNHTIIISSEAIVGQPAGTQIDVTYIAVDLQKLETPKTKSAVIGHI